MVWPFEQNQGSDLQSGSGQIATGTGWLTGLDIITDGTNNATVILYDNTAASGRVLYKGLVVATTQGSLSVRWPHPLPFVNGVYLSLSGASAGAIINWAPR